MNVRRLQGWALIVSGLLGLLATLRSDSPVIRILLVIGAILLILGVPAIEAVQRLGGMGVAGIVLIELAVVIALIVNLTASGGGSPFGEIVPLISAVAGALGRVVIGWLTTRQTIFPAWAGWAFIVEGVLNFLGGILGIAALAPILGVVVPLVGAAALLGYGTGIIRHAGSSVSQPG